jgi:hypothetical protein
VSVEVNCWGRLLKLKQLPLRNYQRLGDAESVLCVVLYALYCDPDGVRI